MVFSKRIIEGSVAYPLGDSVVVLPLEDLKDIVVVAPSSLAEQEVLKVVSRD